jgi:hypothetical protein
VEQRFIFICINFLVDHFFCTTRGDQQEQVVGHSAKANTHVQDLFDIMNIVPRNRCVDLEIDIGLLEQPNSLHGFTESADNHSKPIMLTLVSAIDGNAHPLYSR